MMVKLTQNKACQYKMALCCAYNYMNVILLLIWRRRYTCIMWCVQGVLFVK